MCSRWQAGTPIKKHCGVNIPVGTVPCCDDLARDSVPEESTERLAAWSSVSILELCFGAVRLFFSALVLHWNPSLISFPLLISCHLQLWVCSTLVIPPLATELPRLGHHDGLATGMEVARDLTGSSQCPHHTLGYRRGSGPFSFRVLTR